VLGAGITDSDKIVDTYVDKGKDIPELDCKELASGIEVSVLQSVGGLIPLDKEDNMLLLLDAAGRLDGAELMA
jgi:hypothetical protein